MKFSVIVVSFLQALAVSAAPLDTEPLKREVQDWNAKAWSNFVKVYAVPEDKRDTVKREVENWNAKAWSNFVKVYAVPDDKRDNVKREDWNAKAWSNFVKVYAVPDEEK
ncbi:hypothetical protein N431DRAFT_454951 [Stipitochalara longipes BDJ]|nr:hypothetical protein N431DRAFT_454951 [Stipitochalara longipes BDJ]